MHLSPLQLSLPMEQRRNFTTLYNKMKLSQVMELAPTVRSFWGTYNPRSVKPISGLID